MILMPWAPRRIALHRTAEHDAFLELLGDAVGDQLGIDFGLAHFFDVDGDRHAQKTAELLLEVLDVFALFADHHARTGREDGDAGVLGRTLNQDARDSGVLQLGLQILAHLDVLGQHAREAAIARVPAAGPVTAYRKTEASRVDFLSHVLPRPFSCQPSRTHGTWAC
jgi:hypothetical protein